MEHNIFKDPIDSFEVELFLPIETKIKNGKIKKEGTYLAESHGVPVFENLNDAVRFIDFYFENKDAFICGEWDKLKCF